MRRYVDLEGLMEEGFLIFDTCALLSPLNGKNETFCDGGVKRLWKKSADYFLRHVNGSNIPKIFITDHVKKEYRRILRGQKARKFVGQLKNSNSIIDLGDIEPQIYYYLKSIYQVYANQKDLSTADYDFVLSGILLSQVNPHDRYSLISNDGDLMHIARFLRDIEKLDGYLGLARRVDFDRYELS
jgi:hypothetical protein